MPGLRFAPLIRVSTEKQEKRGESLNTQKADLEADIKSMDGKIFKSFSGQEHATPTYERKILDELLNDAKQNKFDAVIIWSLDRWSRDNKRSAEDLQILKDNNIRFFVRTQEYDLHDENAYFMISLYSLMGRTQAYTQTRKSIINRIARAKQGAPTSGRLPYGRIYDKKTNLWTIDHDKQLIIQDVAKRYLSGESMEKIANHYGMNLPNMHKLLKYRCGDTWEQSFRSKQLKIDETVTTKIPRLLPESIIKQIHDRSEGNKTYFHGLTKHDYLLSRMIFCEECGYALTGILNISGKLYYKHQIKRGCKKSFFHSILAELIEQAVINDIFRMLGDKPAIEAAAKAAIPNLKEIEELKRSIEQEEKQLHKIKIAKNRLIDQVADGTISNNDIKDKMTKLKEQEAQIQSQLSIHKTKCENVPDFKAASRKANLLLRLSKDILRSHMHLSEMTFNEKRKLLQVAFAGKDVDGKRYGAYINKNKKGDWIYTIRGIMGMTSTNFASELHSEPLDPSEYLTEDDYIKQDMVGNDVVNYDLKGVTRKLYVFYDFSSNNHFNLSSGFVYVYYGTNRTIHLRNNFIFRITNYSQCKLYDNIYTHKDNNVKHGSQ
jgi:DNA invertase Pin-like site-specific DNA recombinase